MSVSTESSARRSGKPSPNDESWSGPPDGIRARGGSTRAGIGGGVGSVGLRAAGAGASGIVLPSLLSGRIDGGRGRVDGAFGGGTDEGGGGLDENEGTLGGRGNRRLEAGSGGSSSSSRLASVIVCSISSVELEAAGRMGAVSSFDSVCPPPTVSSGTTEGTSSQPISTREGRIDGRRGGRVMDKYSVAPDVQTS